MGGILSKLSGAKRGEACCGCDYLGISVIYAK